MSFCAYTYSRMMRGLDDRYNSFNRANHLKNGEEEIYINGSKFMPSLELIKWKSDPAIDKVLTPNGINITELQTYVEPNIVVALRNKSFNDGFAFDTPGNTKRIIYPMRICKIEDFTDNGFNASESFEKFVTNRLCPDVPIEDHYRVKNLYQNKEERVSFSI